MCGICSAFRPYTPTCDYEGLPAVSGAGLENGPEPERMSDLPTFTNTQIAAVLTDEHWEDRGVMRRALDVAEGETVTYDISGLRPEAQELARFAIQAWDDLLGFEFEELESLAEADLNAEGDAGKSRFFATEISVGDRITGTFSSDDLANDEDRDFYAVTLEAGQTYTASLAGLSGRDVDLAVRRPSGTIIESDMSETDGRVLNITFTAETSGTYYLDARDGFEGQSTYALSINEGDTPIERPVITFDERGGVQAFTAVTDDEIEFSQIQVDAGFSDERGFTLDSETFQVYIHEVGHAIGLGHAGFYNFDGTYEDSAHYANDSILTSIMSYWDQVENTAIEASFAHVITPMIADVLALETLYGPLSIREDDTVYGANSNVEGYLGLLSSIIFDGEQNADLYAGGPVALTIADTGGIDTLDLSTVSDAQRVELEAGGISDVAGLTGNLVIAENTVIERFEGGSASDIVFGNAADNRLDGNAGDDILRGATGNDLVRGGAGDDTLYGGSGSDELRGGSGNDTAIGSSGNDDLFGNGGRDRLDGNAGDDDLRGGDQADALRGHDGVDRLWGDGGGDYLSGGGGNDRLFGGDARDFVYGGRDDDRLAGEAGSDRLYGQSGDDYLIGGADTDWLYGGTGADTFLFGETFDRDLVRDFEDDIDTLFINDNLWSGTRTVQDVLNEFATEADGDVVFDFGDGDVLVVENIASAASLVDDILIV